MKTHGTLRAGSLPPAETHVARLMWPIDVPGRSFYHLRAEAIADVPNVAARHRWEPIGEPTNFNRTFNPVDGMPGQIGVMMCDVPVKKIPLVAYRHNRP